jgi:hypothetical protein
MTLLTTLTARAEAASAEETAYRRETARRIETLERGRAFAYRRLNLLRKMLAAGAEEPDAKKAADARLAAAFVEIGWIGGSLAELDERHREAEAKLRPVAEALGGSDEAAVLAALEAFEAWFAEKFGRDFCSVFERYAPDTPKVDF